MCMNIYSPGESWGMRLSLLPSLLSLPPCVCLPITIFCLRYEKDEAAWSTPTLRHWFVGTTVSPLLLCPMFCQEDP